MNNKELTTGQDEEIDLSNIPEVTEAQMERAVLRISGKAVERGKQRPQLH